jgi:hypothetical protein
MVVAGPAIRCRQIIDADIAAVTTLLARGFKNRGRRFWENALRRLGSRLPPPDLPQYGYLLESSGTPVGVLLVICSTVRVGDKLVTRCNLSSWYAEPAFRAYAPLMVAHALKHKGVTYLNISPALHTRPIIEAQGFSRYSDGVFIAMPTLSGLFARGRVTILDAQQRPTADFEPSDRDVLLEHAALGCTSLWCATAERAYPFVFRPRLAKKLIPYAHLIYCRQLGDFTRFAGPIGRFLARRGRPIVILDSNGPIPGLVGVYRRGQMPKYFKGAQPPRLGDLAYTEYAVMGV